MVQHSDMSHASPLIVVANRVFKDSSTDIYVFLCSIMIVGPHTLKQTMLSITNTQGSQEEMSGPR